jgi:ABC-type amino acid transport substrate-binding protein
MHPHSSSHGRMVRAILAISVIALAAAPLLLAQAQTPGGTLARIRDAGKMRIGYRPDARPFAYSDESGQAAGYSIALCQRIADAVKNQPGFGGLPVEWVGVNVEDRFRMLRQGQIDLLCGGETVTLARRGDVSFSIPIFPGGVAALIRADAPVRLREVLSGHAQPYRPTWRAAATQVLQSRAFTAVRGTTSLQWLTARIRDLQVIADVSAVPSYETGLQSLLNRRSDAFFGERAVLLDAARRHASARDLTMIDRLYTYEPLALALQRDDEAFRLFVDRTLSRLYSSGEMGGLYTKWFGEPDGNTLAFFRWNTLPD